MNDTFGNENSSSIVFTLDTINPVASASCSPSSVSSGATVSCTCSGTDGGSGINASLTTAGSTPSTLSSGTFSYTCSVTDNAGNSHSDSASYTVIASSSSSGGGGYPTYSPSESKLLGGYGVSLGKNYKVSFNLREQSHSLTVNDVSESKATITISSDPITLDVVVGATEKVDVDSDGAYDLSIYLKAISSGRANFILTLIDEEIVAVDGEGADVDSEISETDVKESVIVAEERVDRTWIIIIVIIIVVILVLMIYFGKKYKEKK